MVISESGASDATSIDDRSGSAGTSSGSTKISARFIFSWAKPTDTGKKLASVSASKRPLYVLGGLKRIVAPAGFD